jgi:hypothetical protein
MPTLEWIGKKAVLNHHNEIPFKLLKCNSDLSVGFRQGTRLGIIGFDFALGEGDALATAKVHFRLINRF